MKEYVTMTDNDGSSQYRAIEKMDSRFYSIKQLFSPFMRPYKIITWFFDQKDESYSTEWVSIQKENNSIALYDVLDSMDEEYTGEFLNPEKRFEMSRQNFIDLLYHWEALRVSKPDTILIVIHEDNHITLETDPVIIKQYQDAGYAFDINKNT
jgi:hypothetical protein